MARYGYGISVCGSRTAVVASSGEAVITTSRAFDSSGVQVGSTNTGDIPADWMRYENTITSVIFANDNSVTSIGSYAFAYCTSLTSITIPNSVTSLGVYAFKSSTALATVLCYVAQEVIGSEAFYNTASPLTIRVPTTGAVGDTWNALVGTGQTFQGNTNVTVIRNL